MSPEHPTRPPVLLGDRYRLDELIGSGGMGRVHRAWDTRLGRRVAIKVLSSELAADPDVSARLRAEGQLLAALQHPNVVTLHDIPDDPAVTYLVMELVEGESLAARLRREGPLPAREVSAIITGVAAGLSALHGAGIVHGDVSPANVLLGVDGRARLADLGLAHDLGGAIPTADGFIHGTLRYLAPERLDGAPGTPASDVYALAAVTYAALVGRPPAVATDVVKLRVALAEPPIRPSLLRPGLAPSLDDALLAALGPADGRPDAYHLAVALAQGLRASVDPTHGTATTTGLDTPVGVSYRSMRGRTALGRARRTALALTAGILLLAVGSASLVAIDGALARPGRPGSGPLTAQVETASTADVPRPVATAPVTVTASAQRAPATAVGRHVAAARAAATPPATPARTATTAHTATTARPPAAQDRATSGAPSTGGVQTAPVLPRPTTIITAVRPAPIVQLPATVATKVPLPASSGIQPLAVTGGDLELATGVVPHTRSAATTRIAPSRATSGTESVVPRPVTTATVVRHEAERADRSGRGSGTAGRSGREDRSDSSEGSDHEDRAARDRGEEHSGKG